MIRTIMMACTLPDKQCRELNQESGRIYTRTMVVHRRIYRKHGIWLTYLKHNPALDFFCGPSTLLHSHSVDAAQQDYFEACKTAKELKKSNPDARYPYKRKFYHTTTWKHTAIKIVDGRMRLSLAQGQPRLWIELPQHLRSLPEKAFRQVQLCYSHATNTNTWHLTVEDGAVARASQNSGIMAVDLGEIHPAACTDGETTTIITCRELRANAQHRNKKTSKLQERIARCKRGSKRHRKLVQSRKKLQAKTKNRQRDMLHKVSRAIVEEAEAMGARTIVMGDVRTVADKTAQEKRLNRQARQKIANWPHGQLRQYVFYKAAARGIEVEILNEAYTSKTCPQCGQRNKPRGRTYRCPVCGFVGHRDNVGCSNILSRKRYGELARVLPPAEPKYRYPVRRVMRRPTDNRPAGNSSVAHASGNPKR